MADRTEARELMLYQRATEQSTHMSSTERSTVGRSQAKRQIKPNARAPCAQTLPTLGCGITYYGEHVHLHHSELSAIKLFQTDYWCEDTDDYKQGLLATSLEYYLIWSVSRYLHPQLTSYTRDYHAIFLVISLSHVWEEGDCHL